jgi:hypothetical protein
MALAAVVRNRRMKDDKQQQQPEGDPNLDIPSEANRTKHINFLEVEEESSTKTGANADGFAADRQKQWQEGLEEGERARREDT